MRNVASPYLSLWESEPQGEPTGMRVWDLGESESRAVIVRIRAIARPEREQTSEWSLITRQSENSVQAGIRRLGADMRAAGASPGLVTNPHCPQMGIVKV